MEWTLGSVAVVSRCDMIASRRKVDGRVGACDHEAIVYEGTQEEKIGRESTLSGLETRRATALTNHRRPYKVTRESRLDLVHSWESISSLTSLVAVEPFHH